MRLIIISMAFSASFTACGQKKQKPPKATQRETASESGSNSNGTRMYGGQKIKSMPKFTIPLSASTDPNSIYYFKTIEKKLEQLDTTLSLEQSISLTKYYISKKQIDPNALDRLAEETYELNEKKEYKSAIKVATKLLELCPNSATGHNEIALAYNKIGRDSLGELHFAMLKKILDSVFKFSDGSYESPFIVNHFYEGISLYEAAFKCFPDSMVPMLDKNKRLLGAYKCYSPAMNDILIRYTELSHWKFQLTEEEYIIESK
jgi:tetratricopeptide (TPR) repeat protein